MYFYKRTKNIIIIISSVLNIILPILIFDENLLSKSNIIVAYTCVFYIFIFYISITKNHSTNDDENKKKKTLLCFLQYLFVYILDT